MSFDPISDRWTEWPVRDAHFPLNAAALDPDTRRLVITSRSGEMFFYDLQHLAPRRPAPLKGKADWGGRVGLAHHPPSRQVVLWEGGREVWTLDSLTWEVCKLANESGPAPTTTTVGGRPKTHGIYGRWRYVPGLDAFIAYNDSSDNVWLYKLPGRSDPAPSGPGHASSG